ncbi:MAG: helix-turn-helix domain-containing protein [Acidobacteria bacterium]|nr:helix-turn-helix domain-containing protein [Acidobacteriota bacterium]NIM63464.1 helix-turn-helix domain-containing protein [Acidobacteriota bacterium]NIO60892.1 helix-turn-helix domain-containing protein [Acidobacteriota bacterium]NIQ31084.1 helix-turn-helix domain-containing protein [Acidobacteriota bacterium]NIQ87353.1 helix-turn-helix domain-containing protein [Acidobacteriota bacterium]
MSEDVWSPDIGRRLCAARLRRGLSQGTVARLAGIGPSYVSRIENGKIHPSFRTVVRLQRAMKADLEELAGPQPDRRHHGLCPISSRGSCLLDLIRPEVDSDRESRRESYTPRQVRLLRSMATWVRTASTDRLRAMEVLIKDLSSNKTAER